MSFAICTLCAGDDSPGFYTGCMVRDGHAPNWVCDGRGHLVRVGPELPLLTGPFGFGTGDSITLRLETEEELDQAWDMALVAVLRNYSCYPPAVPKIIACLRASRRYDCVVQSGWFRSQYTRLMADLNALGVSLWVTFMTDMDKRPLR